eukprot:TRINITY_DN12571_c0_g3_i1.p2 TRINITY_DN12571_c0_g3~~TRINITY_DN12571_c0_g3_i1.p2  ORF type:complete len:381 (+),score=90.86 TRINITY_DN12571_c0_g3_i1:223-1365(+)
MLHARKYCRRTLPALSRCPSRSWSTCCRSAWPSTAPTYRFPRVTCKKKIEFIRNGEEAMERCQKQDTEYETLRDQYTTFKTQATHEREQDKETLALQSAKLADLQADTDRLMHSLCESRKTLTALEEAIRQKDKIIAEYGERFDLLEEQAQSAAGESAKASSVRLVGLQKEIEGLRRENEELQLNRQKEANTLAQERLNSKKSLMILEKNVSCLMNEKTLLENKLKMKIDRSNRRCASKEVQTDNIKYKTIEDNSTITKRDQEIDHIQKYANSLKNDRDQALDKLSSANKKVEELASLLSERTAEVQRLQKETNMLKFENIDLKRRREAAAAEIKKLSLQAKRREGAEEDKTGFRQKKRTDPKIPRHISEAVSKRVKSRC